MAKKIASKKHFFTFVYCTFLSITNGIINDVMVNLVFRKKKKGPRLYLFVQSYNRIMK